MNAPVSIGTARILIPDASVGVKWTLTKPDSTAAIRLLDPRFRLHAPAYFLAEVASVLQRKAAVDRTISEAEALNAGVSMTLHPTEGLLEQAIRLGIRYRRPVYDSLYLVLATTLGGQVFTADARLYRRVQGGPLDGLVLWLSDPL